MAGLRPCQRANAENKREKNDNATEARVETQPYGFAARADGSE